MIFGKIKYLKNMVGLFSFIRFIDSLEKRAHDNG